MRGLNVDDEIVAIDQVRVRADRLDERLEQYAPGDRISMLVARRDRLLSLEVVLGAEPPRAWRLEPRPGVRVSQRHPSCTDKVSGAVVTAMRTPTAVLDLEISGKFTELNDIGDFEGALVLFRLHGRPLGWGQLR